MFSLVLYMAASYYLIASEQLPDKTSATTSEIKAQRKLVDLDAILPALGVATPRTHILPLPKGSLLTSPGAPQFTARNLLKLIHLRRGKKIISPLDDQIFAAFSSELDKQIREIENEKGAGAFIKLSTRSPKDYFESHPDAVIQKYYSLIGGKEKAKGLSCFTRAMHMVEAMTYVLRAETGKQAMDLLLNSTRVEEDLDAFIEDKEEKNISILIREYLDFPIVYEFRAFVYQDKLTAISQAFHTLFFPELQDVHTQQSIVAQIEHMFVNHLQNNMRERSVGNYVIDMARTKSGQWVIIELNPFRLYKGQGTDGMLFDWEKDEAILKDVDPHHEVVLRVQTKEIPIESFYFPEIFLREIML